VRMQTRKPATVSGGVFRTKGARPGFANAPGAKPGAGSALSSHGSKVPYVSLTEMMQPQGPVFQPAEMRLWQTWLRRAEHPHCGRLQISGRRVRRGWVTLSSLSCSRNHSHSNLTVAAAPDSEIEVSPASRHVERRSNESAFGTTPVRASQPRT
jgi:hypothetical protein